MFLHDESAVNTEKNDGCVRKEYVRGVVGGGGAYYYYYCCCYKQRPDCLEYGLRGDQIIHLVRDYTGM